MYTYKIPVQLQLLMRQNKGKSEIAKHRVPALKIITGTRQNQVPAQKVNPGTRQKLSSGTKTGKVTPCQLLIDGGCNN